jgi:hypothetical protein
MAYDKQEILEKAIKAVTNHELTTVDEVCSYLPCDISTLYLTEEWKIEVLEPLKKEIEKMKTNLKAKMKQKWRQDTSAPALQIAAFKLMATDEELNILSTSKVQNEHSGEVGVKQITGIVVK